MKQFFWLTVLGLVLAGCSKEDAAEMSADEAAAVAEQVTDMATDIPESPVADTEALVVVEESAAEVEPEDQTIVLARADDELVAVRNWQFKEGKNYTRMIPTQPTVGGADKIEVAEVFMYSCPHCYDLEAYINRWAEDKDPSIRFVRIPASFNQLALLHAQLYYTEIFLGKSGKLKDPVAFRNMVFEEYHRRSNRLTSQMAIQRLFARAGVNADDFNRIWNSFEVNQALRVAADLARRYNITSVPMVIVNGKYRTDMGMAGSYPKLIELIDELTVREGLR
ncbi:MAG: thiol:disulfide interchange protein DsbA/DsbL [Proteobacteria bacterium]|nr:thiol:disulfide interchange protein DsbA/DsbL [Pseudomonadota bacterium]